MHASTDGSRRAERHLTILMGARLAISLASLVIAVVLDRLGGNVTLLEWQGFYGAVVLAFVATLVYRVFAGRIERLLPFAIANIVLDLCLVSLMVMFSGGSDSVFSFLYVVVPVYASLLLPGRGAVACALLAGCAYAGVLGVERAGLLGPAPSPELDGVLAMRWFVHTGAIVLVATLANFLVGELERAGRALDERTLDLEKLRALHQRTVESLKSGLLTTDAEGRITSFNLEAERITGVSRAEAHGRDVEDMLPGLRELLRHGGGQGARSRMRFVDRDGEELHLGVGAYALQDGEGPPGGHVVIFQDVSAVVEMERDLTRSERLAAVGALSASIAHEIRNPLAAISGAIQILRKGTQEASADPQRLMDIAVREVDRLNELITDFLGYARPAPLRREPVLMDDLVAEIVHMLEAADGPELEVSTDLEPGLAVYADPDKLRQVIWNLLRNGSEAMPGGGALHIGAARAPAPQGPDSGDRMDSLKADCAEISVMDQGAGIEPGIAERIFDPFFTTKKHGSGLGLPTVHRIVEEHGGSIRIDRPSAPWSTAVRIRLPLAEAAR